MTHNTDTNVVLRELGLLCACLQCLQSVLDELLPAKTTKLLEVFLEIGLS
jgi:hypothetical protein